MRLNNIEGIIFDAEGVVVNTEVLWDRSQQILLEKRGYAYDKEYLKPRMAGQTLKQGAQLMIDYYDIAESVEEMTADRKRIINELFDNEITFMDGFSSFIEVVCDSDLKIAVATAMKKDLMIKVEKQLDLREFFNNHIYFIEDVGNRSKPEPDVFLHAAEKIGIHPSKCVVIEDAPHGIDAANRAGMTSIGIATTFKKDQLTRADFAGNNFTEILHFLRTQGVSI